MQRYSSVTLHVSPKNPISAEKLKITFSKIQILPPNFFPEWFGPKQVEAIRFRDGFHEKPAQTDFYKEMWVSNVKGLKHLNTVLSSRGSVKSHETSRTSSSSRSDEGGGAPRRMCLEPYEVLVRVIVPDRISDCRPLPQVLLELLTFVSI